VWAWEQEEGETRTFPRLIREVKQLLIEAVIAQIQPEEKVQFAALIAQGLDWEDPKGRRYLGAVIPYWRSKREASGVAATLWTTSAIAGRTYNGQDELAKFEADWLETFGAPFTEEDQFSFDAAIADWMKSLASQ
jgi:hypothetical protein